MNKNRSNLTTIQSPEGFIYYPNFISTDEEKILIKNILTLKWEEVKMHGIIARRRVVHFGLMYAYNNRSVIETASPPTFLKPFIHRAATLLKIPPEKIAEILITEYPINAGIGWHKDAPIFGEKVFGISLFNSCTIKFRIKRSDKFEISKLLLEPRSAYILSGQARTNWQHSIPAVKAKRYSITFRTLRAQDKW